MAKYGTPVARFWTRMADPTDGLFIGATMVKGVFEPNTIYEIVDVMGEKMIRKIGKGLVAESGQTVYDSPLRTHCASDISDILTKANKYLFLTTDEYASLVSEANSDKD